MKKLFALNTKGFFDFGLVLSLVFHFLVFSGAFFTIKKSNTELKKNATDPVVIVLDSVEITNSTNLNIKDTSQNSDKILEKKFATSSVLQKQKSSKDAAENISIPSNKQKDIDAQNQDAPTLVKKPKSKPAQNIRRAQDIKTSPLKEDDQLASLLQSLDEETTGGSVQNTGQSTGFVGKGDARLDKTKPIGIDAINSIRAQFIKCWNVPISIIDIPNLVVVIEVLLDENGRVISAVVKEDALNKNNAKNVFASALADSALRAVYACSPIKNLPKESYNAWKNIQLNFSASDML